MRATGDFTSKQKILVEGIKRVWIWGGQKKDRNMSEVIKRKVGDAYFEYEEKRGYAPVIFGVS